MYGNQKPLDCYVNLIKNHITTTASRNIVGGKSLETHSRHSREVSTRQEPHVLKPRKEIDASSAIEEERVCVCE